MYQMRSFTGPLSAFLLMLATGSTAAAAELFDDFKAIEQGVVTGDYVCRGTQSPAPDIHLVYSLTPRAELSSRVTALSVRGNEAEEATLVRIGKAIGKRGIENVSVNCTSKDVRIVLTVYDKESTGIGRVVLLKRKDAQYEVTEQ